MAFWKRFFAIPNFLHLRRKRLKYRGQYHKIRTYEEGGDPIEDRIEFYLRKRR